MREPISVVINAGGESRRMGRAKALLPMPVTGEPLLHYLLRRLAPLVSGTTIVVAKEPQQIAEFALGDRARALLDDDRAGGPLGGMATGLAHCTGWALLVACDLPLINPAVCRYLIDLAHASKDGDSHQWQAIVPFVQGWPQPLHALYHASALGAMQKKLAAGERRATSFLADILTRWVTEEELRPFDPELRSFINVNTPEDWAAVLPWLAD